MELSRNRKVILDTSILIFVFERGIDIDDEILREVGKVEILIPRSVINELERLSSSSKGSRRILAKAARELVRNRGYQIIESKDEKDVDRDIMILAKDLNAVVATLDKKLIEELKKTSIGVLTWKNKRLRLI
ncbi:MAG: twitching motility protein PilT [Thermoplasmata archaeon]|nr:MAG: twitching motility protein PilT [Thermoplasmata archaeon]